MLQPQAGVDRFAWVVEPQKQAVAQLFHNACRRRECTSHHPLLALEERERHVVSVGIGECREADDVGEDDGSVFGHQRLDTRIAPLMLATAISPSCPGEQSHSM